MVPVANITHDWKMESHNLQMLLCSEHMSGRETTGYIVWKERESRE